MQVITRSGKLEKLSFDKIINRLAPSCEDIGIDPITIAKDTISNMFDKITTETPYNVNYLNLDCNLAQSADTNLENVTAGYSYNREMVKKPESVSFRENYCSCGFTKVYNDALTAEYYDDKYRRRMMVMKAASEQNGGGVPTDFWSTPYNVAYQKLYSGLAREPMPIFLI